MIVISFSALNDRDVISVGSRDNAASAKNKKDVFVYVIKAPLNWTLAGDFHTSGNSNDLTVRDDAGISVSRNLNRQNWNVVCLT